MEKKDIYVITNNITGTQYVGQSNNAERRFRDHKTSKDGTLLHQAMQTYGSDNFSMEIIESQTTAFNELEKYWIKKLNTLYPNGYNMVPGGGGYPHLNGELCYQAKLTQEQLEQIIDLLQTTGQKQIEIGKQFGVTQEIISNINLGRTYYNKNLHYPIRENTEAKETYNLTCKLLRETTLSLSEIGKQVNMSKTYVNSINQGKTYHNDLIQYPIRKLANTSKLSDENILLEIKNLLENSQYSTAEIGAKYNVKREAIEKINQGKSHFHPNWNYPLRKFKIIRNRLPQEKVDQIEWLLQNTQLSFREIAKKVEVGSHETISKINSGKTKLYKKPELQYPLRKPF